MSRGRSQRVSPPRRADNSVPVMGLGGGEYDDADHADAQSSSEVVEYEYGAV